MNKKFLQEYLLFTRKERIGILVIILLILAVWALPGFLKRPSKKNQLSDMDTSWITAIKKMEQKGSLGDDPKQNEDTNNYAYQYDKTTTNYFSGKEISLFYFDPNSLPAEGWKKLGLHEKTIHTIQNYLAKGGHFYKPEDLEKVYGLYKDQYERLVPFVRIKPNAEKGQNNYGIKDRSESKNTSPDKSSRNMLIDINMADTNAFISLPGIGNKLASRIINFRDKLGGFYSVDQVGETYGLPDSTFIKIKPLLLMQSTELKKININTATKDELKTHPYIRWNLANAIIEYRNQHGQFSSLEDLKKITLITEELYEKMSPYLRLQ
jgi:competence protein ComEA